MIELQRRSRADIALINRLGNGRCLEIDGGEVRLSLALGQPDRAWTEFRCAGGLFALQNPNPLMQLLTDCPPLHQADSLLPEWYWSLLNAQLPPELLTSWGALSSAAGESQPAGLLLHCQGRRGEQQQTSLLALGAEVVKYWLDHGAWQPCRNPLPAAMPISLPLCVATLSLSSHQLAALRPGDLLIPCNCGFAPSGIGQLQIGTLIMEGELCGDHAPTTFTLTDYKESSMIPPHAPLSGDETSTLPGAEAPGNLPLQDLPLELSVRCGSLCLTLGELQQLAPGSTLTVDNIAPGDALLCHGNFPLAKGELVDVEGRLGFQVVTLLNRNPLVAG